MRTADESLADYRVKMGTELGSTFHAISGELVSLHCVWGDYLELWGHSPERVDTLNRIAATFFYRCEQVYWRDIVLHIARLTDAPGTGKNRNLSIQILPEMVDHPVLKQRMTGLVTQALTASDFVKSWRNIALAHKDYAFAVKAPTARQIEPASRMKIRAAIAAIEAVMSELSCHYCDAEIMFAPAYDGAGEELILILDEVKAR